MKLMKYLFTLLMTFVFGFVVANRYNYAQIYSVWDWIFTIFVLFYIVDFWVEYLRKGKDYD